MPRILLIVLSILTVSALTATAAPAKTRVAIGLGDQSPRMLTSPLFKPLKVKKVRYFLRWDAMRVGYARRGADQFVAAARRAGVRVLLHISTNDYRKRRAKLPSLRAYKRSVGAIVRRYRKRGVREFGVWNEANHYTQPTYRNPRRAAQYFLAMRRMCPTCTIVALDVLDQRGVESYIRRFYRALGRNKARAKYVGIHNYGDVNRFRTSGTRSIIRTVRKQNRRAKFWLTETGGLVSLGRSFPCSPARAARAVNNMFRLAYRFRRDIDRVYAYNWFGSKPSCKGFDAGLVSASGKPRKGYRVFKRQIRRFAR